MLSDALTVDTELATTTRSYGIYAAPVFVATVKLHAIFAADDLAQFRAAMRAPWRDPRFTGAALPLEHRIDASGFTAHWHLLDLNRSYGQHGGEGDDGMAKALPSSAFGVPLYQPVDVYATLCLIAAGQYALLVGSLVLLVTVALLMHLTRRIDWYAYRPALAAAPAAIMEKP